LGCKAYTATEISMPVDRPSGDDLERITDSRERPPKHGPSHADGAGPGPEIVETRTRAEYYHALRAAVDQPRSAWDDIAAATRPPLDALRVPVERATHILDGDATGGGHRPGTGAPGKTEFPAHWDDDTILNAITAVAHSPHDVHRQWNQRWKARGEFDNVLISVIVEADGRIWTAWPEEGGPGVARNPKAGAP